MKGSIENVTYDRYGRMQYHPDYHPNHGKSWKQHDQTYLIERYDLDGPEQVSFALGRTIHTIMTRAYELRKAGLMPKPATQIHHRRLRGLGK
ncbi:hypothetical protein [Vibrio sp. ER1A]|uniref:hypothetical protein n=1 Tax=Vibrio sp. ER1A TaxID=1517681 RepID=UPI0004DCFA21|nr:hypothetical protein [Vibrio sp. ER1A]KFA99514.1 hypothetical protein HW45_03270 [Vibrio sp. ER1A]